MPSAKPLTAAQIAEYEDDPLASLVKKGSRTYLEDDLHTCSVCGEQFVHEDELNDRGECSDCADEADEADSAMAELGADWRSDRGLY